jgi:prepilin-type N-terminal cleavage/methylation domain-containing protein
MWHKTKGFTLTEVVVAITIIGIIAAFNISKLYTTVQLNKRNAIFRETISTLNAVVYEGVLTNTLKQGVEYTPVENFFNSKLSSIKFCAQGSTKANCWTWDYSSDPSSSVQNDYPSWLLPSGAVICIQTAQSLNGGYQVYMDWNGDQGPNAHGVDQILLYIPVSYTAHNTKVGQLKPLFWNIESATLFNEVYE